MSFKAMKPITSVKKSLSQHSQKSVAALGLLLLASLCCMAVNGADPDLWGHVQFGRDVLDDGLIQPTTTYSFTATGYRWINHENLSEILLAFTYDNFGIAGLIAGKFLLAVMLFLIIIGCSLRKGVNCIVAGIVAFLVAINLSFHWHFRPQIASFFLCALMLWILEFAMRDWHTCLNEKSPESISKLNRQLRWLWLCPVLLCLWANSHGGFVAGTAILLAFLGGRSLEAIFRLKRTSAKLVGRLAMIGLAAVLATLVNPYGPDLHLWLIQSLGEPRPEIKDWHPIAWMSANGVRFLIVSFVAVLAVCMSRRKRDWTQLAILVLVWWQASSHVRHVPFFVLLFGFWVPIHLQGLVERLQPWWNRVGQFSLQPNRPSSPPMKIAYIVSALLLASLCFYRSSDLPVDKSNFPVEAIDYMASENLSGRLVVTYNWAQYVIGAFGGQQEGLPVCPVAFDGRFRTCYPQQIVDMHFDFVIGDQGPGTRNRGEQSGPPDETRVLSHGQPDLVLISRRQRPSVDVMNTQTNSWSLLYQDKLAQIWGRKSTFDDPQSPAYLPQARRTITDKPQTGFVTWPALPGNFEHLNRPNHMSRDQVAYQSNSDN